jgi:hypothetical protein
MQGCCFSRRTSVADPGSKKRATPKEEVRQSSAKIIEIAGVLPPTLYSGSVEITNYMSQRVDSRPQGESSTGKKKAAQISLPL